jgi:transposase
VQNRLRWHLHELDPALHIPSRGLRRYRVIEQLADRLDCFDGMVARLARSLVDRCYQLTREINALERELRARVRQLAPGLLAVPGCGVLGAAMILGETAGAHHSAPRMPTPGSTEPHRFRCGRATPRRCGSTAAATAR